MSKRLTVLALVFIFSLCVYAVDEKIQGVVKDNTGGVIPGVKVVLTSIDTGASRQALSDDSGNYIFTNIRVGNYELKAELEGFQPVKVSGIKVNVGDKLNYPVTMVVSTVTTEVEVKADVLQVQTTTSQLDSVVDEKRIVDLPLNGRNPMDLVYLTPGVTSAAGQAGASANGTRGRGNNYQLDGMDNNDTAVYGTVVDLNVDAAAEFRVITSNPSAEYGRAGGMIVDLITKSGTNQYHGNAFWFGRRAAWDSNSWYNNFWDEPKGAYRRDQYGGSVGGPIIKDKLFFFFNTQITKIPDTGTVNITTPLQSFRDSMTNASLKSLFNTYYPLPNQSGEPNLGQYEGIAGTYTYQAPQNSESKQYTIKGDYNLSAAHALSVRYFVNPSLNSPADPQRAFVSGGRTQSGAVDWTYIISPSLVNNAKFAINRVKYFWYRDDPAGGVDLNFGEQAWNAAGTNWAAFSSTAGGLQQYNDQYRFTGTAEWKEALTWNKGKHSFKFGIDYRRIYQNGATNFYTIPVVWFEPDAVGYAGGNIGNGSTLANIRAGLTTYQYAGIYGDGNQFTPGWSDYHGWRTRELDFYVQDDWKIRPNIMLNLGLRYELKPATFEVNDLASNYDTTAIRTTGYHLPNQNNYYDPANWTGGVVGTNPIWQGTGVPERPFADYPLYPSPKKNFGPRAGISWDPWGDGKTAVRAGYGISYDRIFDNIVLWLTNGYPYSTNGFLSTHATGYDGTYPNNNAYYGRGAAIPSLLKPLPANYCNTGVQISPVVFNLDWHQPYTQSWQVSIQREFLQGNIFSVTYVGTAGVHMLARCNPNQMPHPAGAELATFISKGYTAVPAAQARYLQYDTQFTVIHMIDTYAHSDYNGMQLKYNRRFMNGLQAEVNYTWSKAFDNNSEVVYTGAGESTFASDYYNMDYDRGFASFDCRHVLNATFIYELPFGAGKWIGGKTEGWMARLIGGWQINGIFTANTGYPLDYKVARDTLGTLQTNATRRPGRPFFASTTVTTDKGDKSIGRYPKTSAGQANFYYGTDKINLTTPQGDYYRGFFRTGGSWNFDFSLFKEVKLPWFTSEGSKIQLRAEAFNLFNHPNFGGVPNITLTSANCGRVASGSDREIQIGLKFVF